MKKVNLIVASLFIFLIVFSAFAYAAGSSGNSDSRSDDDEPNDVDNDVRMQCENMPTIERRVKCRLMNEDAIKRAVTQRNITEVHESCRNLNVSSKENCRRLYKETKECYAKNGAEKTRCFKLKTGFAKSAVSGQGINKEAARSYLVTLLYELEERIEDKVEDGIITADEGAALIAKIVEIKEKIMMGAPGSEIRPLIQELKRLWMQTFRPVPSNAGNQTTGGNETNSTQ